MTATPQQARKLPSFLRAIVEVGSIIFLFYTTLLMREFTQTNGQGKSFAFALEDIFTVTNCVIALISGLIGYVVLEYLRKHS
jgi:Na+/melibiose symporter-like transporter